ncbi:MAG: small multi-drug export protein [Clostridia bacterium]|nr:small multi-drug export protein [Clostridia bacterium]
MLQHLIETIINALGGVPAELIVFIISLFPILELRGGLIAASILHIDMWKAIPICIAGNILPIPFILLFIEKIFELLKNTKLVKLINKLEQKAEDGAKKIMKYKKWGLLLFVGIPLPGTGAWTGSLVAALFHFKLKDACLAILGGIVLATVIMCFISYGIPYLVGLFL